MGWQYLLNRSKHADRIAKWEMAIFLNPLLQIKRDSNMDKLSRWDMEILRGGIRI